MRGCLVGLLTGMEWIGMGWTEPWRSGLYGREERELCGMILTVLDFVDADAA